MFQRLKDAAPRRVEDILETCLCSAHPHLCCSSLSTLQLTGFFVFLISIFAADPFLNYTTGGTMRRLCSSCRLSLGFRGSSIGGELFLCPILIPKSLPCFIPKSIPLEVSSSFVQFRFKNLSGHFWGA